MVRIKITEERVSQLRFLSPCTESKPSQSRIKTVDKTCLSLKKRNLSAVTFGRPCRWHLHVRHGDGHISFNYLSCCEQGRTELSKLTRPTSSRAVKIEIRCQDFTGNLEFEVVRRI